MHPVIATATQPLDIGGGRIDREQGVMFGDREVVHHRAIGRVKPLFAHQFAGGVDHRIGDFGAGEAVGLIAVKKQFAGLGVNADMCRHRFGFQRAVEIIAAERVERDRINAIGAAIFLGHQQAASVPDRGCIGDGAIDARHVGIIGKGVAIPAKARAPRLVFRQPARGADIAHGEIGGAIGVERQAADHAVARQHIVVGEFGREMRIGNRAVKAAAHFGWQSAFDGQGAQRDFLTDRLI